MRKMRDLDFTKFAPELTPESDWGRCMQDFLNQIYRKSSSPHSQDHYRGGLEQFFSIEPRRIPSEYTRADIEAWLNSPSTANGREGQSVKPQTYSNRLIILTGLYKYATSYGVQGEDGHQYALMKYLPPTSGIRHPKRADTGNKALSDQELSAFFKQIDRSTLLGKRDYAFCLVLLYCARRRDEIRLLQRCDISQELIVDGHTSRMATVYRFFGKGKKTIADFAELPPVAATALFDYLEASGRLATMEPGDYLFTTLPGFIGRGGYDPKRPLSEQAVLEVVQRYRLAAGIERHIGTHSFRHTCAVNMLTAGASLKEIQTKLRHRAISTTSLYLETLVSASDPTIDRLNAKFGNL